MSTTISDIEDLAFDLEGMKFDTEADRLRSAKAILSSRAVANRNEAAYDKGWSDSDWWREKYEAYKTALRNMGVAAANLTVPPPDKPTNPWRRK